MVRHATGLAYKRGYSRDGYRGLNNRLYNRLVRLPRSLMGIMGKHRERERERARARERETLL